MFDASLKEPTENSIAQAEWASRLHGEIVERPSLRGHADAYEARAWELFVAGKFEETLAYAQQWFDDQPFSVRPPMLMSWIMSAVLDAHQKAIEVLQKAVRPNPNDPEILNRHFVASCGSCIGLARADG